MRRDIENILDDCLTPLLLEGKRLEDCLAQYSDHRSQLEPLLRLAKEIRELPRPEPRPGALRATQARVREAAIPKRCPEPVEGEGTRRGGLLFPWLAGPRVSLAFARGLAVVIAVAVIGFSTVVASADSLPHSPLYPVKRTTERVQLLLTLNPGGKAYLHLAFAERRLNETMRLMSCCQSLNHALLRSMLEETDVAIRMICALPRPEAEPLINKALELTAQQHACLSQMKGEASTEMWCILNEAIAACRCYEQMLRGETPEMHQPTVVPDEREPRTER